MKRRPSRGVITRRKVAGDPFGTPFSEDAYVFPLFPHGVRGRELLLGSSEIQREVALIWFTANFQPRIPTTASIASIQTLPAQAETESDGDLKMSADEADPVGASIGDKTISSASPSPGGYGIAMGYGVALTGGYGRLERSREWGAGLPGPGSTGAGELIGFAGAGHTAQEELFEEFGDLIDKATLDKLASDLSGFSSVWDPISVVPLSPFRDLPSAEPGQDAIAVSLIRAIEALTDHLRSPIPTPPPRGQNYWPGAELLDDEFRDSLGNAASELRAAVLSSNVTAVPAQSAVEKLSAGITKMASWCTEGAMKELGAASVKLASGPAKLALYHFVCSWSGIYQRLGDVVELAKVWIKLHSG